MTKIPRIRCPVCGMSVFLKNIGVEHELGVMIYEIGGKQKGNIKGRGKAKGKIKVTKVDKIGGNNSLNEFWVKYLVSTLKYITQENVIPEKISGIREIVKDLIHISKKLGYDEPIKIKWRTRTRTKYLTPSLIPQYTETMYKTRSDLI